MDPRDVIYFTEVRFEKFRREREHDRLVKIAKQANPPARFFRFFPLRLRGSDTTTD